MTSIYRPDTWHGSGIVAAADGARVATCVSTHVRDSLLEALAAPDATELLCRTLKTWQESQGLPHECAYEQLIHPPRPLTGAQRTWLNLFSQLWDATTATLEPGGNAK